MQLRILSDIHLEAHPYYRISPMLEEDKQILLLAGDIIPYTMIRESPIEDFFSDISQRFKQIIYIPGNHEYYHGDIIKGDNIIKESLKEYENIDYLNEKYVEIDGVKIIGCALWTDIDNSNPISIAHEARWMADYKCIHAKDHKLTPGETIGIHKRHKEFLSDVVDKNSVVMTHHCPSYQSMPEKFRNDSLNPFFYNEMDEFIYAHQPRLWVHGHVHDSFRYNIGDTEVICNPKGYFDPYRYGSPENPYFRENLLVRF